MKLLKDENTMKHFDSFLKSIILPEDKLPELNNEYKKQLQSFSLPAYIKMIYTNYEQYADYDNISENSKGKQIHNNIKAKTKPNSEFKSVSSSFSSITRNGSTKSSGKTIINNSNKPYLQVEENENGLTNQYIIPKNTINYNKPGLHSKITKRTKAHRKTKKIKASSRSRKSNKSKSKHSSKAQKPCKVIKPCKATKPRKVNKK